MLEVGSFSTVTPGDGALRGDYATVLPLDHSISISIWIYDVPVSAVEAGSRTSQMGKSSLPSLVSPITTLLQPFGNPGHGDDAYLM